MSSMVPPALPVQANLQGVEFLQGGLFAIGKHANYGNWWVLERAATSTLDEVPGVGGGIYRLHSDWIVVPQKFDTHDQASGFVAARFDATPPGA
jgi:hypothetical protein